MRIYKEKNYFISSNERRVIFRRYLWKKKKVAKFKSAGVSFHADYGVYLFYNPHREKVELDQIKRKIHEICFEM